MDSFAVSVSNGLSIRDLQFKRAIPIAFSLAVFQGTFPILGWLIGSGIEHYIVVIDHWMAFVFLGLIGLKMIYDGLYSNTLVSQIDLRAKTLIAQSFATSIDAFIVGISLALLNVNIILAALIIGSTTFLFSMIGIRIGKYFGQKIGKSAAIIGGFILIGIGMKILIEHLYF